jgi:hypothetical protein
LLRVQPNTVVHLSARRSIPRQLCSELKYPRQISVSELSAGLSDITSSEHLARLSDAHPRHTATETHFRRGTCEPSGNVNAALVGISWQRSGGRRAAPLRPHVAPQTPRRLTGAFWWPAATDSGEAKGLSAAGPEREARAATAMACPAIRFRMRSLGGVEFARPLGAWG